jgi:hypothetical protein
VRVAKRGRGPDQANVNLIQKAVGKVEQARVQKVAEASVEVLLAVSNGNQVDMSSPKARSDAKEVLEDEGGHG